MCPPVVAAVAIGASVLGTITQMQGQKAAGEAAQQQAQYQAQVAENNKVIAENNRIIAQRNIDTARQNREAALREAGQIEGAEDDARAKGQIDIARSAIETKRLQGRQRAVLAANGILVDDGSALDITSDTAALGKLDQLTIKSNVAREAAGYTAQANNARIKAYNFGVEAENFATQGDNYGREAMSFQTEADARRSAGSYAVSSAKNQQFSTLLSGVSSVASKWYGFSKGGGADNFTKGGYGGWL